MIEFRKTEKIINGKWVSFSFEKLKNGDKFRLFEKDDSLVKDNEGNTEFISVSNAYPCEPNGNFMIDT